MAKNNTKDTRKSFFSHKPSRTSTKKVLWNAFGLRREDQHDQAALTFARLGLLAYRW